MSSLRISGLVKFADGVRRDLTYGVSVERRAQLRREVAGVLHQVGCILAEHQTQIEALPSPTRRAYEFLAGLNWDSVKAGVAIAAGQAELRPLGSVRLVGLKSHWEGILQGMANVPTADEQDRIYGLICASSESTEGYLAQQRIRSSDLTTLTRTIRGWLALFAQRRRFDQYLSAVANARAAFVAVMPSAPRFHLPAIVEFRPTPGFYRMRGHSNRTRVILPTPMICFTRHQFDQLARAALCGGDKRPLAEATSSEEYQDLQAELDALSGLEETTAGVHRDLAGSFERMNNRYFGGTLDRPRLTWSRVFTGRKFGHFDPIRDTVMISCTLDRADTAEYVLDFVMYHELLHKKLGVNWQNGRTSAHTPEFRRQERRFESYAQAEAGLKRLATNAKLRTPVPD